MRKTLAIFALVTGIAAAGAQGAPTGDVVKLRAVLTPAVHPSDAPKGRGVFTATLSKSKRTLTWRLTYGHLTSPDAVGHVHKAAYDIAVWLCDPCRSATTGTSIPLPDATVKAIAAGKTFVQLHTTRYSGGEVAGPLKVVG